MRKSSLFLLALLILILLAGGMLVHAVARTEASEPSLEEERRIVRQLGLTDLCLATEAGYTRHISQNDRFTPFQDHPFAFEHFPSGSLLPPPGGARRMNGHLARATKKYP